MAAGPADALTVSPDPDEDFPFFTTRVAADVGWPAPSWFGVSWDMGCWAVESPVTVSEGSESVGGRFPETPLKSGPMSLRPQSSSWSSRMSSTMNSSLLARAALTSDGSMACICT